LNDSGCAIGTKILLFTCWFLKFKASSPNTFVSFYTTTLFKCKQEKGFWGQKQNG
jgi:hypothetical protein